MSETTSCRERLAKYCIGNGLDIGFGGDPIVPNAICLDRMPGHPDRATVGDHPTHLVGDASDLHWFHTGCLDFVFSSHCLEDFEDTRGTLREWLRVLRPGGNLVLFLPDQQAFEKHCATTGQPGNSAHIHRQFGFPYVRQCLFEIGIISSQIVYSKWPVPGNPYSFDLVVRK